MRRRQELLRLARLPIQRLQSKADGEAKDAEGEAEKAEAEKAEAEKAEVEKAESEKAEAEKDEAEKDEAKKAEAEMDEAEKANGVEDELSRRTSESNQLRNENTKLLIRVRELKEWISHVNRDLIAAGRAADDGQDKGQ